MSKVNVFNNSNEEFNTEVKKYLSVARYAICPKNSVKNLAISNEILEYSDWTYNIGVRSGIQTSAHQRPAPAAWD